MGFILCLSLSIDGDDRRRNHPRQTVKNDSKEQADIAAGILSEIGDTKFWRLSVAATVQFHYRCSPKNRESNMNRREFLGTSATAAVSSSKTFYSLDALTRAGEPGVYKSAHKPLDRFVEQYMRVMNAPGMTLVLADREGIQRVATYGFSDVETKSLINPDQLFQIGSISKSFVALCLLQLHDEGKLDLHKPVRDYLSWFRIESPYEPITTHHLLTHTSGLPGTPPVFLSDPAGKHRAAYAPGKQFHYNNMAFTLLGHLLMSLDAGALPEIYRKRIFDPLGMTATEPVITFDQRDRTAKNYFAFQSNRPFALCETQRSSGHRDYFCRGLHRLYTARHGTLCPVSRPSWRSFPRRCCKTPAQRREFCALFKSAHQGRRVWPHRELRIRNCRRYA